MKQKIWPYYTIYILTIADVLFTSAGISAGFIEEANPFLLYLIQRSLILTMAGVLIFVASVLYFFYKVSSRIKWMSAALTGIIGIKFGVLILHAFWILAISA